VRDAYKHALARSLEPEELLCALQVAVVRLLHEASDVPETVEMVRNIEPRLHELTRAWETNREPPPEIGDA
jgi:hypothetical protein